jgi:hypothetical protein
MLRKYYPTKQFHRLEVTDYPDALIVNKARSVANQKGYELNYVYTFDRAALEIKGT